MKRTTAFVFNLLQDVNALLPVVHLVRADFETAIVFLVTEAFLSRDATGVWLAELRRLQADVGADDQVFGSPDAALAALADREGVLFAGSESNLTAHHQTHGLFRAAPPGFLRVTLQHGFTCVGFLHNREHQASYGSNVRFAADVLCGWFPPELMASMHPGERSKLLVTGPQSVLLAKPAATDPAPPGGGLICENMHSLRFSGNVERRTDFMDAFAQFCAAMAERGEPVHLRPHPGGQYVVKNGIELPANALLENGPMSALDLARFAYGISAPSTVVLDMVLAGIPTAVWIDAEGGIDVSHYEGLPVVSGWEDWVRFAALDEAGRDDVLARQRDFLARWRMPLDPGDVRSRFAGLLAGSGAPPLIVDEARAPPARILFVANSVSPTLSIFYLEPLAELSRRGRVEYACLTEELLIESFAAADDDDAAAWLDTEIARFAPDLIVACRYNGPHAETILGVAERIGAKLLYLIDDDLLKVPRELGDRKYKHYRSPPRRASLTAFLGRADLVHCATPTLMDRIARQDLGTALVSGDITSSSPVRRRPSRRLRGKIGYMGFDHDHDLATILPAIANVMDRYPHVGFELLGGMDRPAALDRFGERVSVLPPIRDYGEFVEAFARIDWDIGLCPLAPLPFNRAKTNVKWLDYTAAGIAVVASAGTVYDACCADGCGILAANDTQWIAALEMLLIDHDRRFRQVERAQARLAREYSPERFRAQMLAIFEMAAGRPLVEADPPPPEMLPPALTTRAAQAAA